MVAAGSGGWWDAGGRDRWEGVNLSRAVRVVRDLVSVTAEFPAVTLDRLVLVGGPLWSDIAGPVSVMWDAAERAPDVRWADLLEEAYGELIECLDGRTRRGLTLWDGTREDVEAVMAVVACESAARAFRPLTPPDLIAVLQVPWRTATG